MAIELKEKGEEQQSITRNIVFAISLLIFIASALGYVFLKYVFIVNNETKILELNQQFSSQKSETIKLMETEAYNVEGLVGDYKILFDSRVLTSRFFSNFEQWAHPQIYYSDFSFDSDKKTATMKGYTSYFGPIIQQIEIFKNQTLIENYSVSNVKLAEAGGVNFDLSIIVKSELFK
jgi:hypothetical protein